MRRPRSDSVTAAIAAAQAPIAIDPPAHVTLRECDMPFWSSIIAVRAASSWNSADLMHAARLARCHADIERVQQEIDEDGEMEANQKHRLLETLMKRAVYLSRLLHVHAEATCGKSEQQAKRAKPEQDAQAAARSALIPRLSAVA